MNIFFKSFLSVFFVSIILSFFISNTSLAANYQLDAFAKKAGYATSGAKASLESTIQLVINTVLSLTGIIFLALTVYAGVRWMTAQGNAEDVTKAKDTLQAAIIGMVVISISYAVTGLVFSKLGSIVPEKAPAQEEVTPPEEAPALASCASASGKGKTEVDCKAVDPSCEWDADLSICSSANVCKADLECVSGFCKDGKCIDCSKANNKTVDDCKAVDDSCEFDPATKICSKYVNYSDSKNKCGGDSLKKCTYLQDCKQTSDCLFGLHCDEFGHCKATPEEYCWDRNFVWEPIINKCVSEEGHKFCISYVVGCINSAQVDCLKKKKDCYFNFNYLVNPQLPWPVI